MSCKYCKGYTDNEESICDICMLFGPPEKHDVEIEDENVREPDIIQVDIIQRPDEGQSIGTPKGIYFNNSEYNYLDPNTIWSFRQDIPELIVQDCIKEFNLDDEQAEKLRIILMARGVNKWMLVRRQFIKLKLQIKEMLKDKKDDKKVYRAVQQIYVKMQNMARMPRWVKWPNTTTHKWKNIEKDIEIKGKHC